MPCTSPIRGYRTPAGTVTFSPKGAYVDRPASIACGQCIGCRVSRTAAWTTRLIHEAQITEELGGDSSFITLTYDDAHMPPGYSLQRPPRDWQLFAKRVRKALGPFRFFMCGEYGEKRLRPHHHAILFGHAFREDRELIKHNAQGDPLYFSPTLQKLWGNGLASVGDVTPQSARYVASYSNARITGQEAEEHYTREHNGIRWLVEPEYATMSLKPGIGQRWLVKYGGDIYPSDTTILHGRRVQTPPYYDTQLAKLNDSLLQEIKKQRRHNAIKRQHELTPDRLSARAEILRAQRAKRTL